MLRRLFATVYSGELKQKEAIGKGRCVVLGVYRTENTELSTDAFVWEKADARGGNWGDGLTREAPTVCSEKVVPHVKPS